MFCKVKVNILLLEVIKQVPKHARFLKELCSTKRKFKRNEKVAINKNASTMTQKKLSPKHKDLGMFTIPCAIGNAQIKQVMLDLEAPINVMLLSMYSSLNLCPLKETRVVIQLEDGSNVYFEGVLEDLLVQVDRLIF
mgnify:CR=1 FL=1